MTVSTTSPHTETASNAAAKYRPLLSQIFAGFGLILFPAAFYDTWELKGMFRLDVVELRISTTVAVLLLIVAWAIAPVAMPRKLKASAFLVGAFVLALIVYAFLQDWVSVYLLFPVLVPIVGGLALVGWFLLRSRPGRSFAVLPILLLSPVALFAGAIATGWAVLVLVPAAIAWAGYLVGRGDGGAQKRAVLAEAAQRRRTEANAQAIRGWQDAYELANPGMPVPVMPPGYSQPSAGLVDPNRLNTLAVLALVFGILGGYLAIVFGHIAKRQIKRTGERGSGLATAGLVLGYAWLGATVAFWIVIFVLATKQ